MKLVIDIPEQMYLNSKEDLLCGGDILVKAIKNGIPHETVTEFADRCRECGERYGKLLKEKTGHNCNEDYADCDQFVCSECGIELQDWHRVERDEDDGEITYHEYVFRYCPNCGCRMIEPQESEVQDERFD